MVSLHDRLHEPLPITEQSLNDETQCNGRHESQSGMFHGLLKGLAVLILPIELFLGCMGRQNQPVHLTFAEAFQREATIPLETCDSAFIGAFSGAVAWSEDKFVVADPLSGRVLMFDERGRFLRKCGLRGSGPGEYSSPALVCNGYSGSLMVFDDRGNSILFFDSLGEHLATRRLTDWTVSGCGSNGETIAVLGREFRLQAAFAVRTLRDTSIAVLRDATSMYEFPELSGWVSFLAQLGVDDSGCVYVVDPLSCRITKLLPNGEIAAYSEATPENFRKPAKDLDNGLDGTPVRGLIENQTPVTSVVQVADMLFVVWVDRSSSPQRIMLEIYDRDLAHVATGLVLPKEFTPWIFSDGRYVFFAMQGAPDSSGEPTNPVFVKFSYARRKA